MSWLAEYEYGILWILFQEQCRFWCLEGSCLVRQFHKSPTRVYRDLSIYIAQPSLQVLQPSWKNAGSTCFCYKSSFTGGTSWNSTTHFAHLIVFFGIFWYILYIFSSWINRNPKFHPISPSFSAIFHPYGRQSLNPRDINSSASSRTKTCRSKNKRNSWKENTQKTNMVISENSGFPPKSSILIGVSIVFTIHFGVPLFLETPIWNLKGKVWSDWFSIGKNGDFQVPCWFSRVYFLIICKLDSVPYLSRDIWGGFVQHFHYEYFEITK